MVNLQLQLLLLLAAGFVLGKLRMISSTTRDQLTDIVIDVVLPCSIIASFQMEMTAGILRASFQALLAALGIQVLYWVLNLFFSVKISIPLENTGVYSVFATSFWPFSLIFSLARRNEGNFFQAVPTTLSSSLAEVRLASLVAWA